MVGYIERNAVRQRVAEVFEMVIDPRLPLVEVSDEVARERGPSPRDAVPTFILHGGGFGAPDRMKLGTPM
jgi:hypothetical protein